MHLNSISNTYDSIINKLSDKVGLKIYICIFLMIYKVLLDYIYCQYVAGVFSYFYLDVSIINIINGWFIVIVMTAFFSKYYKQNTCSAVMVIILNIIYFIPITTYCGYGGGSSSFLIITILYWLILSLLQTKLPIITYKDNNKRKDLDKYIYLCIFLVSAFSIFIWWKYTNCRIHLNFLDVYDVREEASNYNLPGIISYIRQIVSSIIVPLLLLLSIYRKKYLLVIWLIFITVINFSFAANKSIIFFPIILIGGYIFYRKRAISLIIPACILIEIIAIVEKNILNNVGLIISLFFRRQGFLLAKLSEDYYRFFLENPTDLFRNSIMGKFGFASIYNEPISKVIGNNYETQVINCNNGILADVFSGLGIIGLIVMPIILIICFRIFDFVASRIDVRLTIGLVAYYAIMFANTTWSTILLTHGYLIMCVILFFFPKCQKIGVNI